MSSEHFIRFVSSRALMVEMFKCANMWVLALFPQAFCMHINNLILRNVCVCVCRSRMYGNVVMKLFFTPHIFHTYFYSNININNIRNEHEGTNSNSVELYFRGIFSSVCVVKSSADVTIYYVPFSSRRIFFSLVIYLPLVSRVDFSV